MIKRSEYLRFEHAFHGVVTPLTNIEFSEWLSDEVETAKAMNCARVEFCLYIVKGDVDFGVTVCQYKLDATKVVAAKESRNCGGPNPLKHPLTFRREESANRSECLQKRIKGGSQCKWTTLGIGPICNVQHQNFRV